MTRAREWKLARRTLVYGARTLVMGILNVTPDSFSDGGRFQALERALAHAAEMHAAGACIIDIGGESTRPGGESVSTEEELRRIVPVVERLHAELPEAVISVDTTKAEVARRALEAGAEIVNDISGLRFDERVADEAARAGAGLVLMHSRGTPATLHSQPPVPNILPEVTDGLRRSITKAVARGVAQAQLAIDPGIGFGKTQQQNLELLARLDALAAEFPDFPLLVGTSRKSFIGHLLGGVPSEERLHGTLASVTAAILGGAHIVRVHDVRPAVETARIADGIRAMTSDE